MKSKYKVTGMTCAACSARVERAVSSLSGVDSCEVNLLLGEVTVSGDIEAERVIAAVVAAGYGASAVGKEARSDEKAPDEAKAEIRALALRLSLSVGILLLLMYISMGHIMWGFPLPTVLSENPMTLGLLEMLLSLSVLLINNRFFVSGVRGVMRLAPNMDTLVALGSLASFIYSLVLLFMMGDAMMASDFAAAHGYLHGLYFESAAMIPALITLGKLLEAHAKGKTTSAIRELLDLSPRNVTVIRDGAERVIPAGELRVGEIFVVRRAEAVAADGEIVFGEGSFDEAYLTGESIPQDKTVGDKVYSGTNLISGYIKVRAESVGEETALAEIIRTVKEASGSKAPVAKIADKVAGIFVPAVMAISLIATAVWLLIGESFGFALARGVSVLVISCPCALGLATPVAIMVGSGVGARLGILFKSATALEAAGRIDSVALDKTGTITEGKPSVSDIIPITVSEEELLSLAASLEYASEHPLGRAIVERYSGELMPVEGFSARLGGVFGVISQRRIFGGNPDFIERNTRIRFTPEHISTLELISSEGKTPLVFTEEDKILGFIVASDRIREDSTSAVAELHKLGIDTVMLTGDNEKCAMAVAERLGISEVAAGIFPGEKQARIRSLSASGKRVCMVGDGINDAPALASAELGIAIGAGTNVAIDSADVVLRGSTLTDAVNAIRLGRATLKNVRENLFWAFCYNVIGIPLAAGAFIPLGLTLEPMFGAMAMSVSSFVVVMNALRLNLFKPWAAKTKEIQTKENDLKESKKEMNTVTLKIEGMMCPHCSGRVKAALLAVECVISADVSHERGNAIITVKECTDASVLAAVVEAAGYKVVG